MAALIVAMLVEIRLALPVELGRIVHRLVGIVERAPDAVAAIVAAAGGVVGGRVMPVALLVPRHAPDNRAEHRSGHGGPHIVPPVIVHAGIARLVTGVTRFLQHPGKEKICAVHLGWVAFLFLFIIHFWWFEFALSQIGIWTFPLCFLLICYSIVFVMLAATSSGSSRCSTFSHDPTPHPTPVRVRFPPRDKAFDPTQALRFRHLL